MIESTRVLEILEGHGSLDSTSASIHNLANSVAAGLPKIALRQTAQRVSDDPKAVWKLVYRVVPEATYKRRTRLTPAESERTERLARVIAASEQVWDDQKLAHDWLKRPHPELNGQTPLERSFSELGAREVEELLDRLYFGLPA
jgi:putative toxin-antitoxin system antitoxin component (TIGR02293 family)